MIKTTYPKSNFNGAAVEVWEWSGNFITHVTGPVITYAYFKLIIDRKMCPRHRPNRKLDMWILDVFSVKRLNN